jgi:phosphatidate cytidylyltransferase
MASRERRSGLLKRALSAAVLLPITLFFVWKGGWWFFVFLTIVLSAATWEYVRMLRVYRYRPTVVFALGIVWAILVDLGMASGVLRPLLALLFFASMAWQIVGRRSPTPVEDWLLPLAGALFIGWMGGHFLLLRALSRGAFLLFMVVAVTALSDMGAYFVGLTWGKHRLAPAISPHKTWEGLLGGVAAALLAGSILGGVGGMGWLHGALLGLLLSSLAPLGDLGVSMIKRQVGVKDTSNLIPGHGGVLDRIDSHLVAAVVGYYYALWVMGVLPAG